MWSSRGDSSSHRGPTSEGGPTSAPSLKHTDQIRFKSFALHGSKLHSTKKENSGHIFKERFKLVKVMSAMFLFCFGSRVVVGVLIIVILENALSFLLISVGSVHRPMDYAMLTLSTV